MRIALVGSSGTGKTTSFRNLNPEETILVSPSNKSLPWQGGRKWTEYSPETGKGQKISTRSIADIREITNFINGADDDKKVLIFDDMTHFFNERTQSAEFRKNATGGRTFARWADFGADVYHSLFDIQEREDLCIVYVFHNMMDDDGINRIKTPGKLLDKEIDIASYFTYIYFTQVVQGDGAMEYKFLTNNDGVSSAKTPMGLHDNLLIDNDLAEVIKAIKTYEGQ